MRGGVVDLLIATGELFVDYAAVAIDYSVSGPVCGLLCGPADRLITVYRPPLKIAITFIFPIKIILNTPPLNR